MQYQYLFFDLDGTLTDSAEGILHSIRVALAAQGITDPDDALLRCFIGPPLHDAFQRYCGFSPEVAAQAVKDYRACFVAEGIWENRVYDGIPEVLAALREAGYCLAVATSKPEPFANKILAHFGLADCFALVAGAELSGPRQSKEAVLAYAMQQLGVTDPARALMIGDRFYDVEGAASLGVDCLGVLYGYGDRAELAEAGARYLAATPADILALLTEKEQLQP